MRYFLIRCFLGAMLISMLLMTLVFIKCGLWPLAFLFTIYDIMIVLLWALTESDMP
jgi:hypothetical protein